MQKKIEEKRNSIQNNITNSQFTINTSYTFNLTVEHQIVYKNPQQLYVHVESLFSDVLL